MPVFARPTVSGSILRVSLRISLFFFKLPSDIKTRYLTDADGSSESMAMASSGDLSERRTGQKIFESEETAEWMNEWHMEPGITPFNQASVTVYINRPNVLDFISSSFEVTKVIPSGEMALLWGVQHGCSVGPEQLCSVQFWLSSQQLPLMVLMTRSKCWLSLRSGRQLGLISRV